MTQKISDGKRWSRYAPDFQPRASAILEVPMNGQPRTNAGTFGTILNEVIPENIKVGDCLPSPDSQKRSVLKT
jgi:hypothetical protein